MTTRTGTCHFASRDSAVRYYRSQGYATRADAAAAVAAKLSEGEIQIGPPPLGPDQRAVLDPVDGRYSIVEERLA